MITIELAPLDKKDMGLIRRWRNDYRIHRWCRQDDLISDQDQLDWFERQRQDKSIRMWKIMVKGGGSTQPAGVCGLTSIDWLNRRAEFSIYIAPELHRKGLGRGALTTLFNHGFRSMNLEQIWGETFDGNPAIKLFEALRMKKDGTRRSFYFKEGAMLDAHLYSILRSEWIQSSASSLAS